MKKSIMLLSFGLFNFSLIYAQLPDIIGGVIKEVAGKTVPATPTPPVPSTTTPAPKAKTTTPTTTNSGVLGALTNTQISGGLKEALKLGVSQGVTSLSQKDGFLGNSLVKILMPAELQKVEAGLRSIGMGSLADKGITMLNRAAEDAVKEASPIFVNAITNMTVTDAKNILLGGQNAATTYLQTNTSTALTTAFQPKIQASFKKVGADVIWKQIITTYNKIPLVQQVNPDLTGYVTQQTLNGVYKMVAQKEADIRGNTASRTTDLLKKVFAAQDAK